MWPKKIYTDELQKTPSQILKQNCGTGSMCLMPSHSMILMPLLIPNQRSYTKVALLVAGRHQGKKPDKLSAMTKMLWEKRRVMKRGGTAWDNLEYIQTCKAIRQGMKDDILAFDEKQVIKAIKRNKSLKHARCKWCLCNKKLISIMEEDGTQIHNRDCIVTCCVEFYQELYRFRRLPTDTMEPQQPHRTGDRWLDTCCPACRNWGFDKENGQ